jgi:hypothetical protein
VTTKEIQDLKLSQRVTKMMPSQAISRVTMELKSKVSNSLCSNRQGRCDEISPNDGGRENL